MLNFDQLFTLDNIIILASGTYLAVRGGQEIYKLIKNKVQQDYHPLKQAFQFRKNPEVYHYHLFNYAQKLINQEKPQKSKKYLEIILTADPDYDQANYLMGIATFAEKNYPQAIKYLEKETTHNSEHLMVYFFLSQAYLKIGRYEQALQAVNQAIELNPYYYSSYFLAIDIFRKINIEPEKEWEFFKRAEQFKCLTKPVWGHMSRLEEQFLSQDKLQKRQEFYESLEQGWEEASRLKEKAFRALAGEQFYKAENFALEGLFLNPHDNQWYQLYDQALIAQKKFPTALEFYKEAYQRINFNPLQATLRLVDYYVFNQQYQTALDKMLKIFSQNPNAKFLHYPLGVLYNWVNDQDEALNHLSKAIYYDQEVKKMVIQNPELANLRKNKKFSQIL